MIRSISHTMAPVVIVAANIRHRADSNALSTALTTRPGSDAGASSRP